MGQHKIVRKMTSDDLAAVCIIDQAVDIAPWSEKVFNDCIVVGYECYVFLNDLVVVGFGILSYGAKEAHILKVAIAPQYQRLGFGCSMLQHLINVAKVYGSEEIFLEVRISNSAAINLYKKYNFAEIGVRKGYYPGNELNGYHAEDAITMSLPLW